MYKNFEIGILGEEIATKYLISQGYHIYDRNFRCKFGEIDIIAIDAIDKNELVFIEVKTRTQEDFGLPADAIDDFKIKHLYKGTEFFLMLNNLEHCYIRFDVIEIYKKPNNKFKINHIKNAILDNKERKINYKNTVKEF